MIKLWVLSGEGIFTSAYLEADDVRVGLADLVHDPVRAISEVQVAVLHILEHEILRVAVCKDVVRQDFHLKGAPRRHRLTCTHRLVQKGYFLGGASSVRRGPLLGLGHV